ncbi:Hsp20 family protein [Candidatus Neptunochlamydia vexilliferae]|uniref:SHSP domain-containing protein n=1 Tax=Candidatus Neptunichlamydia vexilliferae TaxID=1651774 RepID=A0ABS0AYK7_9BACT|nr:Hsp20/alpha crystallin family protein [Candidatus Neptunochlamydia vexilliferae]MBF5059213.1 hypothetical protein [Candidatus Neptunochlamydia vexilliferae]
MNFSCSSEEDLSIASDEPGLSVYEEGKSFVVEAALPGISADAIEVTQADTYLLIEGERKEEEKERKYYRRATEDFSYRVPLSKKVDMDEEPEVTFEEGMMRIIFQTKGKK